MPDLTTMLGFVAAALTSLSYIPQLRKALPRGATDDLSLKMLVALFAGLSLWCIYGFVKGDIVIIVANFVGVALVGRFSAANSEIDTADCWGRSPPSRGA
jgi:MtN3 and saliva related transmembrane protein